MYTLIMICKHRNVVSKVLPTGMWYIALTWKIQSMTSIPIQHLVRKFAEVMLHFDSFEPVAFTQLTLWCQ